ncbi:MAG: NUDIX domain-containing protein [Verrucomicrobiia bacterium]|jgi:phosphoglycolate phosphatase
MKIRNIIFDWSGTLVDDLPAVWRATNDVFRNAGAEELTLDTFRQEFQLPFKSFYQRFLPDVGMDQLEVWFHGSFREKQDLVEGLPHAREFLRFCRDRHVRTFLLSTVSEEHYQVQADKTGYGEYIDRPYVGVWDKRKRIHGILKENDLVPDETLFIGDMEHDIDTAKYGGVRSCGVLTGYNKMHQLKAAEPDVLVEHLGELREMLQRNGMRLVGQNGTGQDELPVCVVGAAIFNEAGKILLIRTQKWSHKWGIPGGKIQRGETAEAAIIREAKEETNLDIEGLRFVEQQDVIDPEEFYRPAHFVLLNYAARVRGLQDVVLNEEGEEWSWFDSKEALELELNHPSRRLLEQLADQ